MGAGAPPPPVGGVAAPDGAATKGPGGGAVGPLGSPVDDVTLLRASLGLGHVFKVNVDKF